MLGTLGRVWSDAQERVRIHRRVPLPGSLSHAPLKRDAKRAKLSGLSALASEVGASAPPAPCVHGKTWQEHCAECDGAQQPGA